MKSDKKEYIAPVLTVVTFAMEKGYATSGPDPLMLWEDQEAMEDYVPHDTWTSGSDNFWD